MSFPIMINSFKECEWMTVLKISIFIKVIHKLLCLWGVLPPILICICCCQVTGENKSMYITSIENFNISSQSRTTSSTLNRKPGKNRRALMKQLILSPRGNHFNCFEHQKSNLYVYYCCCCCCFMKLAFTETQQVEGSTASAGC